MTKKIHKIIYIIVILLLLLIIFGIGFYDYKYVPEEL